MKILLLYVSKTGVTKDIATMIQSQSKLVIDIEHVETINPHLLNTYDFIILGAPIYMGFVHKSMRKFVNKHISILKTKNLFLFTVGADNTIDLDKYLPMSYPTSLLDACVEKMHLGGEFRLEAHNPFTRLLIKTVSEEKQKSTPSKVEINFQSIKIFVDKLTAYYYAL